MSVLIGPINLVCSLTSCNVVFLVFPIHTTLQSAINTQIYLPESVLCICYTQLQSHTVFLFLLTETLHPSIVTAIGFLLQSKKEWTAVPRYGGKNREHEHVR